MTDRDVPLSTHLSTFTIVCRIVFFPFQLNHSPQLSQTFHEKTLHSKEEAARCLLCADAPCSKACRNGDPARAVRAIRFGNDKMAGLWTTNCTDADLEAAEQACIHYDRPIRIKQLCRMATPPAMPSSLPNLAVDFCGIKCENPFFLASSAICTNYEMVARAFDAGWAGVFYKTICMQDINEGHRPVETHREEMRHWARRGECRAIF